MISPSNLFSSKRFAFLAKYKALLKFDEVDLLNETDISQLIKVNDVFCLEVSYLHSFFDC